MMEICCLLWRPFFVLPVEQRSGTKNKSRSLSIIKVGHTFLRNFFVSERISIIFGDYESWDLALSEKLESGEFLYSHRLENFSQRRRSRSETRTDTPSSVLIFDFQRRKWWIIIIIMIVPFLVVVHSSCCKISWQSDHTQKSFADFMKTFKNSQN